MKKKILAYMDSPTVKTGFGTVSRNVLGILQKTGKYDIDVFGINYHGQPSPFQKIYNIWPAMDTSAGDPYGRRKFCNFAMEHDFDILFVIQDTFIVDFLPELIFHLRKQVSEGKRKIFRTVMYYPTDSIIKPAWYRNISFIDKLVSYTEFGKKETIEGSKKLYGLLDDEHREKIDFKNGDEISVIYHGVNLVDFSILPPEEIKDFKSNYFGNNVDKFIYMNVNRNQQRKDIPRTIAAFKELKKDRPNSLLYLHMATVDQGWDIRELCDAYGLSLAEDVLIPKDFEPNQAFPIEVLNMLYNCADCVISTTTGEGFGLAWIEAMATNTPVIMPNNTAMTELITEDKGYLVDSGTTPSLWTCIPNDNNILRPLVDVDDLGKVMIDVQDNYDNAKAKAKKAYEWVTTDLPWTGTIAKEWIDVFDCEVKLLDATKPDVTNSNAINTESF